MLFHAVAYNCMTSATSEQVLPGQLQAERLDVSTLLEGTSNLLNEGLVMHMTAAQASPVPTYHVLYSRNIQFHSPADASMGFFDKLLEFLGLSGQKV